MKNLLFLIFTLISVSSFGQPKMTLETYKKLSADFNANPAEYLEKNTTKEYLFTSGKGNKVDKNQLVSTLKSIYNTFEISTQDEKVQQLGNVAIVSGSLIQKDTYKQTPNTINTYKGVFNYIYFNDGKGWKLASSQHSDVLANKADDEVAIKNTIESETQSYLDGDAEKQLGYWSDKPSNEYNGQAIIPMVGQPYAKGESMTKLIKTVKSLAKKQDVKVEREDFEVRMNKDMAWSTFIQKTVGSNGEGMKTERGTRILERINGDWKIVYVGVQGMK